MSAEKKKKINKKLFYYGGAALVLALIFLFSQLRKNTSNNNSLLTATVEKGELVATVGGTGKVEANKSATLGWKTSGNVSKVYVENGGSITSGDILAELSQTSLPQNVILAQADLVEAKRNLETVMESDTQRSQTYLDLLDAEENLQDAQDDIDHWNYKNADQKIVDQARAGFIAAEENLKQVKAELQSLDSDTNDAELQKVQTKVDEAQLARDKALRNLSFILGKTYNTEVAEDFANYDLAKAKLEDVQREWDRLKDGQNKDDILAAQAKVTAAESVAGMANLSAPFDGTITSVMTKEGDEVNAGTSAFRIDDLSKFYIEVDIPEIDINRIQIGQEAEFTFDSLLDKTYHGTVVEVAGAGTESQGETNFTIKLLVSDADENIMPGMTASVSITVLKLEDTLIVPTRAIRLEDGEVVVYVQRNGSIERIPVEIGSSSDSDTQVLSGDIAEGDTLVLNPPQDLFTSNQQPAFTR
ncbi:MAG: efflux RND transporter periplasmic adaptor subunit [Pelolinea sp.]|nr:efflux RND transporter periplasmic adaptor subunit [Pelolinea sp.]